MLKSDSAVVRLDFGCPMALKNDLAVLTPEFVKIAQQYDALPSSAPLTSEQVCMILQISRRTLKRRLEDKEIAFIRSTKGSHRFRKAAVEDYLNRREVKKRAA